MTPLKIEDLRLELVPESALEVRKHGRRQQTVMRRYRVFVGEERVGSVGLEMQTFEQSTPGRMYVNRRWESPRWKYRDDGCTRHLRRSYYETRKEALENLVWAINTRRRLDAEEAAEAAEAISKNNA